jgi:hypothetical protein
MGARGIMSRVDLVRAFELLVFLNKSMICSHPFAKELRENKTLIGCIDLSAP